MQWDEEHINYNFDVRKGPISVEWFKGGTTNICYNALDRHVAAGEEETQHSTILWWHTQSAVQQAFPHAHTHACTLVLGVTHQPHQLCACAHCWCLLPLPLLLLCRPGRPALLPVGGQ